MFAYYIYSIEKGFNLIHIYRIAPSPSVSKNSPCSNDPGPGKEKMPSFWGVPQKKETMMGQCP